MKPDRACHPARRTGRARNVGADGRSPGRTEHGVEVDFVIARRGAAPALLECKWSADEFDPPGMRAFRAKYPGPGNYVIASDMRRPFDKRYRDLEVRFVPLEALPRALALPGSAAS